MKKVKIIVCYHKPALLLKNKFFVPVHVGRSIAFENSKDGKISSADNRWMEKKLIGDDTGENISNQNRNYCELTALYWVWKNQNRIGNPDYIGLMHYRRVLKFADTYKNYYITNNKDLKTFFDEHEFDLILTKPKICFSIVNDVCSKNVYTHFCQEHGTRLTHIMLDCVKDKYPEMRDSLNYVMFGVEKISWYNIFVAEKNLFNSYCEWLFDILSEINSRCIAEGFEMDTSRMMGYYGEVLLNVFFNYYEKEKRIKICYLDDIRLQEVDSHTVISMSPKGCAKRFIKKHDRYGNYKNATIFYKFLLKKRHMKHNERIDTIHSLTYREFCPNGGKGGGSAVLSCQKILLGDAYRQFKLKYSFEEDNFYRDKSNELWDLWAAAYFAYNKAIKERNTAYITHDYGTAFGLYLAGKKYILVSHIQGARVEEKKNFGEVFTEYSAKIIKYCEKKAMENAERLCFPSYGAYIYLTESEYTTVDFNKVKLGPVLYNTLYIQPTMQSVEKIPLKSEFLTILSVGQMTVAKGMDQALSFISNLVQRTNKKIRWVLVGQGPLLPEIIKKCAELMRKNKNFIFSHVGSCSYPQMQYLQNICDVYLMLQRISIFDLATLEAMIKGKCVILSNVGGNREFNIENNIIIFDGDYDKAIEKLLSTNLSEIGKINRKVYDKYFSNKCFTNSYHNAIDILANAEPVNQYIDVSFYEKTIETMQKEVKDLKNQFSNMNNYEGKLKDINKVPRTEKNVVHVQKVKENQQEKSITNLYDVIEKRWRHYEIITYEEIDKYINDRKLWEREDNRLWLILACELLQGNYIEKLDVLVDLYLKKHGEKDIYRYMPLAEYLVMKKHMELSDERVKQSSEVFRRLTRNIRREKLAKLVKGKTIAVVGNGPSEIGRNLGQEIDTHDIVIRFNNYDTKGYEKDYGRKTNIWVRGSGASDVINRNDISIYDCVIFEGDYSHYPVIPQKHPKVIYDYLYQNTPITYYDRTIHETLREYCGIEFPTSGLVTIWALFLLKDIIKKMDIYGFAFRQHSIDNIATHYFNDRDMEEAVERSKVHELDKESEIILKLLKQMK